jgi:AcrR family transcriptional regulator
VGRPRTVDDDTVLDACLQVLSRQGVPGFTLSAVAARVGLRAPTLVERFGGRRALLLAAVTRGARYGVAAVEAAVASGEGDPLVRLRHGLLALTTELTDRSRAAASLSLLYLDLADPDFGRIASDYMHDVRAVIARVLRRTVEDAEANDIDVQRRARTVQSLFHGAILTWALDGDGILTERVSEALDELFDAWRRTTTA